MRRALEAMLAIAILAAFASNAGAAPRYFYGTACRKQNAIAGRVAGSGAGVVLAGAAGNEIAKDIDCRDRPTAFRAYSRGFAGPVGQRFAWSNQRRTSYGYFRVTWAFNRDGLLCRDFADERHVHRRIVFRQGTACRETDGNWHFQ